MAMNNEDFATALATAFGNININQPVGNISIKNFNGDTYGQLVSAFLDEYDILIANQGWKTAKSCQVFPSYLRGGARTFYMTLTDEEKGSYTQLKLLFKSASMFPSPHPTSRTHVAAVKYFNSVFSSSFCSMKSSVPPC